MIHWYPMKVTGYKISVWIERFMNWKTQFPVKYDWHTIRNWILVFYTVF